MRMPKRGELWACRNNPDRRYIVITEGLPETADKADWPAILIYESGTAMHRAEVTVHTIRDWRPVDELPMAESANHGERQLTDNELASIFSNRAMGMSTLELIRQIVSASRK